VEEKVWQPGLFNIRSFYGYYSGHRVGLLSSRRKRVKNIIFDQLSIIARLQSGEIKSWLDKGPGRCGRNSQKRILCGGHQPFPQAAFPAKYPGGKGATRAHDSSLWLFPDYDFRQGKKPVISVGQEAPAGAPDSFSPELKEALAQTETTGKVSSTDLHLPRPAACLISISSLLYFIHFRGRKLNLRSINP